MYHSLTLILILNRLRFCLVALVNFVLVAFWTPNLGGILTKKILKKNHFGHHIFLLWTFLIKMLTTDFLTGFLTVNMRFFEISASEVDSKNRSKKKFLFLFFILKYLTASCSYSQSNPTVTGFSKLKRKKFVRMCDFDWIVWA